MAVSHKQNAILLQFLQHFTTHKLPLSVTFECRSLGFVDTSATRNTDAQHFISRHQREQRGEKTFRICCCNPSCVLGVHSQTSTERPSFCSVRFVALPMPARFFKISSSDLNPQRSELMKEVEIEFKSDIRW